MLSFVPANILSLKEVAKCHEVITTAGVHAIVDCCSYLYFSFEVFISPVGFLLGDRCLVA
jgi:hypothetical protein